MKNLQGTEAQVRFANNLIEELESYHQRFIDKCDKRGVETLKEGHQKRYREYLAINQALNTTELSAGSLIGLIQNYNAGGWTTEDFIAALIK